MVRVHILQGEREMADNNKALNSNSTATAAPRGVPEIEVTFEIDANGIMNVRAKISVQEAQSARIVSSGGLSEAEIDDMIDDAEEHRSSDQTRRALAEAKNQLDGLIYNTRRSFEEFGSNLSSKTVLFEMRSPQPTPLMVRILTKSKVQTHRSQPQHNSWRTPFTVRSEMAWRRLG